MYVCTYVRVGHTWECQLFPVLDSLQVFHTHKKKECQFAVSLRNVNLRSRPGRISDTTCITRRRRYAFFGEEDGVDSAAGRLQRTYLAESSAEASAERS